MAKTVVGLFDYSLRRKTLFSNRSNLPHKANIRKKSNGMEQINDILIVDDDTALVDFVVSALRDSGYVACAAYDGESALLAIETARPALVLLDLHLPGLSGIDVATHLRRHDLVDVPVVLMTGDAPAAALLATAEFPEYLLKPFHLDTLLACIRRYVRRQQRHIRTLTAPPIRPVRISNR